MDGFLLVDKEKGITSFSLCNKIRKKLNLDKCGHSGTLDPNASGLMLIAIDKATKLLSLFNYDNKVYEANIIFGIDTDSYDIDGKIINIDKKDIKKEDIILGIETLKNKEYQIPPLKSAIKKNGKKLYNYKDDEINLAEIKRNVKINEVKLLDYFINDEGYIEIRVYLDVSKGFYVRSFAHDLGNILSNMAIVKELRRLKVGNLDINDAKKIDDINANDIIKIEDFLKLPKVNVNKSFEKFVLNGIILDERQTNIKGMFYVTTEDKIIAIYEEYQINKYKPILIFK